MFGPHVPATPIDLAYSLAPDEAPDDHSPILLLHGLGGSQADWLFQAPVFAADFPVITVDLRGHGRSPKPPGPYTISLFAADVARLLDRLHAQPAHVVGLSLGGAVALQLAIDRPELVRSLLVVNAAARFLSSDWRQRLAGAQRFATVYLRGMDQVAEAIASRLFPRPDQAAMRAEAIRRLAANDQAAYRASLWAVARFDVRSQVHHITHPTLVLAGENDATVPMALKRALAGQIRGSRFQVIADSGHATPLDQPESFNEAALAFFHGVEGPSPPTAKPRP